MGDQSKKRELKEVLTLNLKLELSSWTNAQHSALIFSTHPSLQASSMITFTLLLFWASLYLTLDPPNALVWATSTSG